MKRGRNDDAERDGIRKAALFLSILDEKAAENLLARFEPDVARAIEEEAKTVGTVAPDDVDAIVAEFLALSEADDESSAASTGGIAFERRRGFDDGTRREPEKTEKSKTEKMDEAAFGLDALGCGEASDVVDE
ncbi:MAG: hypothetical protein IKU86_05480, partial [Thermoguttaceae bacterium]|nr:hypothetical protein [Thermoguttaceae bacterium]